MPDESSRLKHLSCPITPTSKEYKRVGGGPTNYPTRDRATHGAKIKRQFEHAIQAAEQEITNLLTGVNVTREGYYVEFESAEGFDLKFESLDSSGLELLSLRQEGEKTIATVFVPKNKKGILANKINAYLTETTPERVSSDGESIPGSPKNKTLIESIQEVRYPSLESLWMDAINPFPSNRQKIWWEIWVTNSQQVNLQNFERIAREEAQLGNKPSVFPERTVYSIYGSPEEINLIRLKTNVIAELRAVKETPLMFLDFDPPEQIEWVENLLTRINWPDVNAPSVCLLDTGVNRGHELISPVLNESDMHAYLPDWPKEDIGEPDFHGTAMAGLAMYGDLTIPLLNNDQINLKHRLESVRILPPQGNNKKDLYGVITTDSISQVEIEAPDRDRVFCLAITAPAEETGQPTEWSATIDKEIFNEGASGRNFAISVGNIDEYEPIEDFKTRNATSPIKDPAQSWNALSVGAFTEKNLIQEDDMEGWEPLAPVGEISPHSRTGSLWDKQWPIKPEVLFEGGNWAKGPENSSWFSNLDSLSLLTIHHKPVEKKFNSINATSASVAQASKLIAELKAEYPEFWPETSRGILVHKAEWTPPMLSQFEVENKLNRAELLRFYGYGVVNEENAQWSTLQDCTFFSQQKIQPFKRDGSVGKLNEMHLLNLPFPTNFLEEIGSEEIRLKVTLSYFVDPNPSKRGYKGRYSYMSHGLRFSLKRVNEVEDEFLRRVQHLSQVEEGGYQGEDDKWFLGTQARDKGSVISDFWVGPASDLAQRNELVIYPVGGWWKNRPKLGKINNKSRYSLIVSIQTKNEEIDLYTKIANEIENMVSLEAEIEVTT